MSKKPKFEIGDEVIVISTGINGTIKEVNLHNENENIYTVLINGKRNKFLESDLRIYRKKNKIMQLDMDKFAIDLEIEDELNKIILKLNLDRPYTEDIELQNAAKLQMYLATIPRLDEKLKENIKTTIFDTVITKNLLENNSSSLYNTYIFKEILNKLDSNVLNVLLTDENNNYYVSNLVKIGDQYYYFDVTLEKAVFEANGSNYDNFVLCCAALGKNSYEQFFRPISLIDFNKELKEDTLPNNISNIDIDIDLVNKILNM